MGTLAEMIKSIASSRLSCDINNNVKIFQQESILISYSSRPSHRVAEESTEETLKTAWTEHRNAVNVTQIVTFRDGRDSGHVSRS